MWCAARSCDEFWTEWSEECSGYCAQGTDPGRETRTLSYLATEVEDVAAAGGCGDLPNGYVEERNCTQWPRCLSSCDDHWSEWSECSDFCSGGVRTRTFWVEPGTPPPEMFDSSSSSIGWDWAEFLRMTCTDEQGDLQQINCTSWETCELVGTSCASFRA